MRWGLDKYLLALALSCYCLGAIPGGWTSGSSANAPLTESNLHFGQHLALSDFDGDGFVDRALVRETGPRESIEIHLSNPRTVTTLSFGGFASPFGSLYAEDIDNDGDFDLVWTDLLHPNDVIVWINDGLGKFERAGPGAYAGRFILGQTAVSDCGRAVEPTAMPASRRPVTDRIPSVAFPNRLSRAGGRGSNEAIAGLDVARRRPCDRGPPLA